MWDSFTSEFLEVDYVGVSAWATKLPPGKVRDEVSHALARGIVMRFPVDALKWSLQIQDAENRSDAISMVINPARNHDPVGAENALVESNISTAERAKWFSSLKRKSQ